jgi:hypothetical protein
VKGIEFYSRFKNSAKRQNMAPHEAVMLSASTSFAGEAMSRCHLVKNLEELEKKVGEYSKISKATKAEYLRLCQ